MLVWCYGAKLPVEADGGSRGLPLLVSRNRSEEDDADQAGASLALSDRLAVVICGHTILSRPGPLRDLWPTARPGVHHLGYGQWWDEAACVWRDGNGRTLGREQGLLCPPTPDMARTRVVLATAHLDHDPTNNRPRNLEVLCQRCHMLPDSAEHRCRRWLTLRSRKALGDFSSGL